jgi:hypothetical protein
VNFLQKLVQTRVGSAESFLRIKLNADLLEFVKSWAQANLAKTL